MNGAPKVDQFKFQYVKGGDRQGLRATRGRVAGTVLDLGDDSLPFDKIADTTTRGNRLVIALSPEYHPSGRIAEHVIEGAAIVLEPSGINAGALEKAIDRKCADIAAARRRAELEASGQQHLLRTEVCPSCGATIDLSGLAPTPYIYCRYCESIFTANRRRITDGDRYRICDECGMFDRIQSYPEFYFYFLLVVYGFRYQERHLCDSCAHRLFLKALALNFLFVVGVPTAIWVKLKSSAGRDKSFLVLSEANALAKEGRFKEAAVHFRNVLYAQRDHPAVLMNQALGHAAGGDQEGARALLEKSIASCNHYDPVLRILSSRELT